MAKTPEFKTCEHKAAVESVNWMVRMIGGRTGSEQTEALGALSSIFNDMVAKKCCHCRQNEGCSELDEARAVVAGLSTRAVGGDTAGSSLSPSAPGALLLRRMHRQKRLGVLRSSR